ncbi:hypothetical protein LTR36_009181 [Oleoguttula mirabilis]|uniref:Uncharacterized protein n=1 Tax=Oleoguttula mirabilis TaxID=1507867 RepID=A0AAV9J611_9PEZI|nr:hypothetical protein LTR36_009181 [Oleoguttula mirabilis]
MDIVQGLHKLIGFAESPETVAEVVRGMREGSAATSLENVLIVGLAYLLEEYSILEDGGSLDMGKQLTKEVDRLKEVMARAIRVNDSQPNMAAPAVTVDQQETGARTENTQENATRQYLRLSQGVLNILSGRHSVLNGLKMKNTLASFHEKLHELSKLEVIEKEGYVLEILAIADPTEAEDDEDVSYLAGIVVLEVLGCNDSRDDASSEFTLKEAVEIVGEVCMGMGHVREKIVEMLNHERAMGEERAQEIDAVEVSVKDAAEKTGLVRAIYIPKQMRKPTIENLEGDDLVLSGPKWNPTPASRKAKAKAPKRSSPTTERLPEAAEASSEAEAETGEAAAAAPILAHPRLILHPPRHPSTVVQPSSSTTQVPAVISTAPPTTAGARQTVRPFITNRGNKTSHGTGKYSIEEKLSIMEIYSQGEDQAREDIEAAHRLNTGVTGRTWDGIRQQWYNLSKNHVTVEMLEAELEARDAEDED